MQNKMIIHCGGNEVDFEQVMAVPTPEPQGRWHPLAHHDLIQQVQNALNGAGYKVLDQAHALNREGQHYFGLMELENAHGDYNTVLGLRNSHAKDFAINMVVGSNVFVCDNLAFSGQIRVNRKHTTNATRDLPHLVNAAVGRIRFQNESMEQRLDLYKHTEISPTQADHLIIEMLRNQVIPATKIPLVLTEWESPRHPEFVDAGETAWRLFNAVTEALKGSLNALPARTMALHNLMDQVAGYQAPDLTGEILDVEDYEIVEAA